MLHELHIAFLDWVICLLDETVLDEKRVYIGAKHLKGSLNNLRSQVRI